MARIELRRARSAPPVRDVRFNNASSLANGFRIGWLASIQSFFGPNNGFMYMSMQGQTDWAYDARFGIGQKRRDQYGTGLNMVTVGTFGGNYRIDSPSDVTLLAVARPSSTLSIQNSTVTAAQNTAANAFSVRTSDGSSLVYRGLGYINGATRVWGGSFQIPEDRPVAITAVRHIFNQEQSLWVNGVKDPIVGNTQGQMIGISHFGNYTAGPYCELYLLALWDRALSDIELRSMADNPYQLFLDEPQFLEITAAEIPILYKAGLGLYNGAIVELKPGSGYRPLVLINGRLQLRVGTEGKPVVLDQGRLRTLATGETLRF